MALPGSVEANRLGVFLWAESLVNARIMSGQLPSFKPYLDALADSVAKAQGAGRLDPSVDPQAVARVIVGAIMGLQVQLTWEPDIDLEASRHALRSVLMGSFRQDALPS